MSWFEKIMPSRIKTERRTRSVPEGLWIKCPSCDAVLYRAELERNLYVCPKCSHHMRIAARERLEAFLEPGELIEIGADISPEDPLKFRDSKRYRDRLAQAQKATGEKDALIVLAGRLFELQVVACGFEFNFLGGSMGSVVGERFKLAVDYCIEQPPAAGVLLRKRRRAHAGGAVFAAADGQDERRTRAPRQSASAVHVGHDRSRPPVACPQALRCSAI